MALSKEDLKAVVQGIVNPLHEEITQLKNELREINSFVEHASSQYDGICKKLESIESENAQIRAENSTLKKTIQVLDQRICQLEKDSNDVRQYTRRDCLEIRGIPETKDEDTNSIVKRVGDLMDIYLGDEAISISHRIPVSKNYKGKNSMPAVIVKFVRRDVKDRFYKARTKLKDCTIRDLDYGEDNQIYINECLTERNQRIFNASLKFKRDQKFAFIWTSNGRTYLRKDERSRAIAINSIDELKKLQASIR